MIIFSNIDGFAVGVTLTKDDQVIVFNSTSLDATTNGSGTVSEHTLNEIKIFISLSVCSLTVPEPFVVASNEVLLKTMT